ncbi:hypothetical protein F4860DRAFT_464029 [Xylaria cubensis]|nr:hypothetical protein F4860DRAFT_464029 [Xylaria cubensis]
MIFIFVLDLWSIILSFLILALITLNLQVNRIPVGHLLRVPGVISTTLLIIICTIRTKPGRKVLLSSSSLAISLLASICTCNWHQNSSDEDEA